MDKNILYISVRKSLYSFLIFWIVGILITPGRVVAQTQNPNIIFILTDDQGYGDVGAYNPESRIKTPNIDRLAKEGVRFTSAHSSSSVCTPSRYSILTGRYPWRSDLQEGVLWGYDKPLIEASRLTVGKLLQDKGYYSAIIGKWHLGWNWPLREGFSEVKDGWEIDYSSEITDGPTTRGFNYFFGISGSLDMPPYLFVRNNRVTKVPDTTREFSMMNRPGPTNKDFRPEDVVPVLTSEAKNIIIQQTKEKNPFLLYFALPSPHTPIVPDKRFSGKSEVFAYGDYVEETDWSVGQILKTLDSLKITGNTVVFFASDNGFAPYVFTKYPIENAGHYPSYIFRGYKADIWEGGHRVPFIVRWPGHIPEGTVNDNTVSLTDFMATVADITGVTIPATAGEDSYSILRDLKNDNASPSRPAIVFTSIDGYFSIQQENWKLIFAPGSGGWTSPKNDEAVKEGLPPVQLYNILEDPTERMNVAPQHPGIVKRLTSLMEQYIANGRSTPGPILKNNVKVDLWKRHYSNSGD